MNPFVYTYMPSTLTEFDIEPNMKQLIYELIQSNTLNIIIIGLSLLRRACSSVDQSMWLRTTVTGVRIPPSPIEKNEIYNKFEYHFDYPLT